MVPARLNVFVAPYFREVPPVPAIYGDARRCRDTRRLLATRLCEQSVSHNNAIDRWARLRRCVSNFVEIDCFTWRRRQLAMLVNNIVIKTRRRKHVANSETRLDISCETTVKWLKWIRSLRDINKFLNLSLNYDGLRSWLWMLISFPYKSSNFFLNELMDVRSIHNCRRELFRESITLYAKKCLPMFNLLLCCAVCCILWSHVLVDHDRLSRVSTTRVDGPS